MSNAPLPSPNRGTHLQAGGVSPLSLLTFFAAAKKVSAAPHRGNANRPPRKQGKAKASQWDPLISHRCEPAFFAYFLCGGKESECRPAQGQREIDHREIKERPKG